MHEHTTRVQNPGDFADSGGILRHVGMHHHGDDRRHRLISHWQPSRVRLSVLSRARACLNMPTERSTPTGVQPSCRTREARTPVPTADIHADPCAFAQKNAQCVVDADRVLVRYPMGPGSSEDLILVPILDLVMGQTSMPPTTPAYFHTFARCKATRLPHATPSKQAYRRGRSQCRRGLAVRRNARGPPKGRGPPEEQCRRT